MSLFGGTPAQSRNRNLVEFKAGKMNLRESIVHPDKRKGLVYLYQGSDSLMHFCWKERTSNTAEDDLVIFPDEIEFKRVTRNTTARVYILKWKNNTRKLFFWMQEPKEDKDEEWCKKINDFLNHPPTPGSVNNANNGNPLGAGAHPLQLLMERMGNTGGIDPTDLTNLFQRLSPNEMASLLSSVGSGGGIPGLIQGNSRMSAQQVPSSRPNTAPAGGRVTGTSQAAATGNASSATITRPSVPTATPLSSAKPSSAETGSSAGTSSKRPTSSKGGSIQMTALSNVLANLSKSTDETQGASATTATPSRPMIDLYDIISNDNLSSILKNNEILERLKGHLPENDTVINSESSIRGAIQSPQFRQAIGTFGSALQTGELGPVLAQFGLPQEAVAAANAGNIQAFAEAMEKHYKRSTDDGDEKKNSNNSMETN